MRRPIFIIIIAPINVTTIIVIIIIVASVIITIATDGTLGIINTYSPVYTTIIVPIIICNITGCGLVFGVDNIVVDAAEIIARCSASSTRVFPLRGTLAVDSLSLLLRLL